MPTFTKLFTISIVLSNSSGLPRSFRAVEELRERLFVSSSIFAGPSEKKATSEPEIKAEQTSNSTSTASSIITGVVMAILFRAMIC